MDDPDGGCLLVLDGEAEDEQNRGLHQLLVGEGVVAVFDGALLVGGGRAVGRAGGGKWPGSAAVELGDQAVDGSGMLGDQAHELEDQHRSDVGVGLGQEPLPSERQTGRAGGFDELQGLCRKHPVDRARID
jgi:hypothetical protein